MSGLLQTEVRTLDRLNDDVLWPCSPAPKSPLPQPRNRDVSTGRPGKPPPRRQASLGDVLGVEAAATSPSSHGVQPKARAGTPVIVEITGSRLAPDTQRLKRTVPGGREESPRQLLHDPAPRPGCPAPSEHLAADPRDRVPALRSCSTSAWAAGKPGPLAGGAGGTAWPGSCPSARETHRTLECGPCAGAAAADGSTGGSRAGCDSVDRKSGSLSAPA